MDLKSLIFAVAVGGGGYMVTNFWMAPLLNYIQAKKNVAHDIVFYANVLGLTNLSELGEARSREGKESMRRNAAELGACYALLPIWYRKFLEIVGEKPTSAVKALIGLSNANDQELCFQFTKTPTESLRMRSTE